MKTPARPAPGSPSGFIGLPKSNRGLGTYDDESKALRLLIGSRSMASVAVDLLTLHRYARKHGAEGIEATWREIATWAKVSESTVYHATPRLRNLGLVSEPGPGLIVFNYAALGLGELR